MTITIDLPEATLDALRAEAQSLGRPAETVAAERLIALYDGEDDLDTALTEAYAQLDAGQDRPFEEFAREFSTRFAARHGLPELPQPSPPR